MLKNKQDNTSPAMDNKKTVFSWALYDWANSSFATTVMAGFFPLFFKEYWADPSNHLGSTFYLGLANSTASIIVAVISPFLGAVADRGSYRKKFLFFFAFLGIVMTGSLWMVHSGQWQIAVFCFVSATIGFSGGNVFYDSLITDVSSSKKMDFTSSLGFAMGYIGGGLLFTVNVLMFLKPGFFGIGDGAAAIRLSFLSVALWWAIFSIPLFLFVRERKGEQKYSALQSLQSGWVQLAGTMREIRHLKVVGTFLLSYWLYIDGVDTIIRMAVDYGKSLNFESGSLITALLMVQFIAFPAALVYGKISERVGVKRALLFGIAAYTAITVGASFMYSTWHFYTLAAMIGLFQGGIQALSRSLYTRIIPKNKSAQFFGFYNMMGKVAAVIGPVLMGTITLVTGNIRIGIVSIIILFICGGMVLTRVDMQEGEKMAREYL